MAELSRVGIAQRIQRAREEAGLKQRELAELLFVHVRSVQGWESQKTPHIPWDRLGEIAAALGTSKEWLIHGHPQEEVAESVLRLRVVDALEALQESQENVHARLDEVSAVLARLEARLSKEPETPTTQDTASGARLAD